MTVQERATRAERIARRVAKQHPDPDARRVYHAIAARAATRAATCARATALPTPAPSTLEQRRIQ